MFNEFTMMHVAGLFVMLGIGADDIFLTIDTFNHTKVDCEFAKAQDGSEVCVAARSESLDDPDVIRERMISSYRIAGPMMLVSSVTTAICFFSNSFGSLIAIRDFGSYMGMVVVCNYLHVSGHAGVSVFALFFLLSLTF